MLKIVMLTALSIMLILSVACGRGGDSESTEAAPQASVEDHMAAQATLAAHYIDAALRAGMTPQEINVALGQNRQQHRYRRILGQR